MVSSGFHCRRDGEVWGKNDLGYKQCVICRELDDLKNESQNGINTNIYNLKINLLAI